VLLDKLPVWLSIIVVSRDVIVVLGSILLYVTGHDLKVRPSIVGKATTLLQLLLVALTLVLINYNVQGIEHGFMPVLQWTTAAVTIASGVQYVLRGMKMAG
jgi:cardiolipin synthase